MNPNRIPFPESLEELRTLLDAQEFATGREAEDFLARQVEAANHAPRAQFLGLSPKQMGELLRSRAEGVAGLIEVDFEAAFEFSGSTPLQEMTVWLLEWLNRADITLTTAGYLPPLVARFWWEEVLRRLDFWGEEYELAVRSEADAPLLLMVRDILAALGLTKTRSGRLTMTKKGKEFLRMRVKDQYRGLYCALARAMDWKALNLEHVAQPHSLLQESWFFSLYLLKQFEEEGVAPRQAAELWLKAFPLVLEAYKVPNQETARQDLREELEKMVAFYCFEFMPRLLGLIDWQKPQDRLESKKVKISKLGQALHHWSL